MNTSNLAKTLLSKIESRNAKIGIVGLGYVGLPICIATTRSQLETIGFDIDPEKCRALAEGRSYLRHISNNAVSEIRDTGRFTATNDFRRLSEVDVVVICVPTPLTKHREPDLTFLINTAQVISKYLRSGQLVSLESTTYPGTTDEVLVSILERSGLAANVDFFVAFSPEREDPGNVDFSTTTIPRIVGADTSEALKVAEAFYSAIVKEVVVAASTRVAEMTKLMENVFRSVNIALVNEMKVIADAMDIDIWEVIDLAKTKPFGYMPFYPGPGLGGHCIPIDPFYLSWKAKEYDISARFIELAGEINVTMPKRVVDCLAAELDRRFRKGLYGTKVVVLGIAYKKNVDDMRESPALKILDLLEGRGAVASYFDPYVPEIPVTREHAGLAGRVSLEWRSDLCADFDAALIVTDHDDVDYSAIVEHAPLVVDTRNACRRAGIESDKIARA